MLLALESELLDEGEICRCIFAFEILQVLASIRYELEQSSSRVKVLLVLAEVSRQIFNLTTDECNLCLRRSGVTVVATNWLEDVFFYSLA